MVYAAYGVAEELLAEHALRETAFWISSHPANVDMIFFGQTALGTRSSGCFMFQLGGGSTGSHRKVPAVAIASKVFLG